MKRVCISLAAALALAVPSFAQVARIGDTTYDTLAKAFAAVQDGQTISLLQDSETDTQIVVPADKDITLDLNGHTYTFNPTGGNNFYAFYLQQVNVSDPAVSLTIEDTSGGQTGTIKAVGKANACVSATDAALTIHGGRFVQEGSFEYAVFATEGLVIDPAEGQTVVFPSGGVQLRRASISPYKEAGATITGGDFTGDVYYALYVGETSGGTTVNISGGTFKAGASGASVCFDVPATANISGGDFSSGKLSITTDGEGTNLIVTGGTFKEPISFADCGNGCLPTVDKDGNYTVSTGNVAAIQQDDGSYVGYSNVATAIAAAENGATVTLIDKGTLSEACTVASGKAITLDLNGQDIDLTMDTAQFTIPSGATLNVVGKGTLRNTTVNYSRGNRIFEVRGASEDNGTKAILKVGTDVTLECTCGIVVFGTADTPTAAYGVEVEMAGTINNKMYAITTNGQITTTEGNVPVIKVTGKINGPNAVGIYAAGYAKWDLAATIDADDALSIKSGDFTIAGGSYTSSAVYAVPPSANPGGNETTGAAISITTSDGYAQKTSVNITGGTFISENGYALYEGIAKKADGTPAANASAVTIAISGKALFQGGDAVNTDIAITEAANKKVLSGGLFTKPVDLALCADGFFPAYVGYNSYGVQEGAPTAFPVVVSTEAGAFGCESLAQAFTASSSLGKVTFTLQQNITDQVKQTLRNRNFDLTLDLNGHTLTFADGAYFDVTTGNLTVTGSGTLSGSTVAPIWVKGGSKATDENYTNVTVTGDVKVTGPSAIKLLSSSSIGYAFGATVTLKGNATCETTGAGILIDENIKKPEGNLPAVIVSENAKIVSGGVAIQGDGYATCSITGGTIQSQGAPASATNTDFAISGGTFNKAPDAGLLAPGFEIVDQGNGQFSVQKQAVASIGDVKYATLEEAFGAVAVDGTETTITVLTDMEITKALTVPEGAKLTLNLDGHTLTAPETLTDPVITNKGSSLTLQTNSKPSAIIAAGGPVIYNYAGTLAGATPAVKGKNLTIKTTAQGDAAIAIVSEGGSVKLSGMTDSLIQGTAGAVGVRGGELSISSALTLDGGNGPAVALSPMNAAVTFKTSRTGATFTSAGTEAILIEGTSPSDGRTITAEVKSGTFTGTGAETVGLRVKRDKGGTVDLTIDNGTVAFLKPIVAEGTDPVTGVVASASFAADALPGETLLADSVAATYPASALEGGITYDDFSGAVRNGSNGKLQEVTLIKDATGEAGGTLSQGRIVKVNLNGHSVAFAEGKGLTVDRASLTIEGEGSLNASGNVAVITMKGSKTDVAEDCATLVVGEQVTLKGQAGVLVTPNGNAAYGVDVVVNGKIEAVDSGINVNGSINVTEGNVPTITLAETSAVTATAVDSVGIYAGGYAIWNLKGDIRAADALSVKCGDITVSDGDYVAFGTLSVPPTAATSGSENTGSAVSITTIPNSVYATKTKVTITGGTFTSENGYALYEGVAQGVQTDATTVDLSITGGTFNGKADLDSAVAITTAADKQVISGGTFSQKPDDALLDPDFVLVENQDGTFGVASAYVASIGDVKYADFNSFFTAFQAIAASETPTTVTLLADLTGELAVPGVVPVKAGRNIVFDLNGHTVETALQQGSSTKHYYAIDNYGTLTIKDSSAAQTGTIRARGVSNFAQGNLTVESGTLVAIDSDGGAALWNEGDAIVSGGKLLVEDLVGDLPAIRNEVKATLVVKGGEVQGQSLPAVINVGTMTIEGGLLWNTQCNVTSDGKHKSPWYYAVLVGGNANASLKMIGGTIRGTQGALTFIAGKGELTGGRCETVPCIYHDDTGGNIWHALYLSTTEGPVDVTVGGDFVAQSDGREAFVIGGNNKNTQKYTCKATVTGGTFIGDEESGFAALRVNNRRKDGVEPIIQGGHFEGGIESVADTGFEPITNFVSGGTFSKPVELAYCAPGYIPVFKDGKYTVDGTAVAAVANPNPDAQGAYLGYDTLKALIDAATDGTEVLIVKSEALGAEVNLLKTATGGDNATDGAKAYEVAETLGGTFKVQDGAIVYAYQLGIADLDVSESGISVTVRLEEDGTAVTRTLEGRKVRVVSDKTVLAEADAIFTDGACVLTVPAADLPTGNLELTISVAPAAEAETLAE